MRKACIDMGSNSFLLLIAEASNHQIQKVHLDEMNIVRLAEGFGKQKTIQESALQRSLQTLQSFADHLERFSMSPQEALVYATSAVREADNQLEFIQTIQEKTGFHVQPISGEKEAQLSWLGASSDAPFSPQDQPFMMDIGGGSTEFCWNQGQSIQSVPMGVVKASEQFFSRSIPSETERNSFSEYFAQQLPATLQGNGMISVAGTATTFVAVRDKVEPYNSTQIHGKWLTLEDLESLLQLFLSCSLEERKQLPGLHPQRADLIIPGTLITLTVMKKLGIQKTYISERGLRFGALLEGK